jgi:glycerophosphoryl diester phosphodiesterase
VSRSRRRGLWVLGILLGTPLAYYGGHLLLRSPPAGPVQVIAHRGGTVHAPENTLAAFRAAIEKGASWLEFDVQMTRDGELVVIHDVTVNRTTDGTGAVRDMTLAQIRALDAGAGERVPTLAEVVALARAHGVGILPETKAAHLYPGVEAKLVDELLVEGYLDRSVIQSFDAASLERLRSLAPYARTCALYGLWRFDVRRPPGDAQFVCPMAEMVLLNPGMIRQAHREGRAVFVWFGMFENRFMFEAMRLFGADGIMSDDPAALAAAMAGRGLSPPAARTSP